MGRASSQASSALSTTSLIVVIRDRCSESNQRCTSGPRSSKPAAAMQSPSHIPDPPKIGAIEEVRGRITDLQCMYGNQTEQIRIRHIKRNAAAEIIKCWHDYDGRIHRVEIMVAITIPECRIIHAKPGPDPCGFCAPASEIIDEPDVSTGRSLDMRERKIGSSRCSCADVYGTLCLTSPSSTIRSCE